MTVSHHITGCYIEQYDKLMSGNRTKQYKQEIYECQIINESILEETLTIY